MLKIIFNEAGVAYSDFTVLEQAKNVIHHYKYSRADIRNVSTGNMLDALRLCVLQGDISFDDICFVIANENVTLDQKANYINLPNNFMDISSYLLKEMRHIRMNIKC